MPGLDAPKWPYGPKSLPVREHDAKVQAYAELEEQRQPRSSRPLDAALEDIGEKRMAEFREKRSGPGLPTGP
jgi:hypothetical protein